MSGGTNLVVPVVLWGKTAPTHCISCIFLARDQRTLVTGCYDGQICLWQVDPESLKMTPRCLLVGHTAAILCLANGSIAADADVMVSSSENGEMCTWELVDGKCRETAKTAHVHTRMQPYVMAGCDDVQLFCNGYYAEVLVIDPFSLDVVLMLLSRVTPDWVTALHVLRPAKRKDDVVLGLTATGVVKVWTVAESHGDACYENESKQIRCTNALAMTCCAASQRTVLVVCAKYCQVYDAGDFSVLCTLPARANARWQGGDFLGADRLILWSDDGKAGLYKLPANSVAESKEFHSKSKVEDVPYLYCTLAVPSDKLLSCPPAMRLASGLGGSTTGSLLLRGDSHGGVSMWRVPDVTPSQLRQIQQDESTQPLALPPTTGSSLATAWATARPPPAGILDQLDGHGESVKLTASIFLPQQSRLVVGREDGSLVIVPASHTVMLQLLHGSHQQLEDWPPHQLLLGHAGRVTCLLYPHHCDPRYEKAHLVSGGVDFAVCLWDLYAGTLLHRFCVHAGEITQLLVPPAAATPRIQKCVCAVSSDHAVTLLSLTERKCVVLASRHLFPVVTIKWRPLDDFMAVGCSDGTVYVWQLETGHLDRVLHGVAAQEVLCACDETAAVSSGSASAEVGLANPAVHFLRGLRHRNLSAIRHATQRGLHQLQQLSHHSNADGSDQLKSRAYPLMIHGLRTNPRDPDAHILCFDIEALIVQLLSEEYAALSPGALESQGLIGQAEFQKVAALTQSASPDAHKKIADFFGRVKDKAGDMERILKEKDRHGILAKMKEGAENVQTKFQAKAEGGSPKLPDRDTSRGADGERSLRGLESSAAMEATQLLLSLLHAWGLDADLDRVCETKLGLLRPMVPVSFGVLSKGGYMSLLLPTWSPEWALGAAGATGAAGRATHLFTSRVHWELSTTLTSQHLLAVVALANTLMGMSNATFVSAQERSRKLHRQSSRSQAASWGLGVGAGAGPGGPAAGRAEEEREEQFTAQQAQIKQGWSLLATLHCVLLPDRVVAAGATRFKKPQVELLATRWQHHCGEVREAAQALLLAELARLGPKGRRALVEAWAPYLPLFHAEPAAPAGPAAPGGAPMGEHDEEDEDEDSAEELGLRHPSSTSEMRRRQTTAVVLLGVVGAEFGSDALDAAARVHREDARRKSSVTADANNLARLTSLALSHLLLAPPSPKLAAHTALRRAAIDLIGRGFTVWEPYLEVSRVLLGLLELCCQGDALVPSMTYGLPLTPAHDSCRTSRHALTLIATARPAAFITTMAREVARYNTLAQNAQALNVNLHQSVLHRAKAEILRAVELLIDKMQAEMSDLLVEVVDIVLHCLDPGQLKLRGLSELFPPVCRFAQVSHCTGSRRVAAGSKAGTVTLYELRSGKCSVIAAHALPVSAVAFSPDGKYLATYCCADNKLGLWQATTGMFGFGNAQTRCVKSYSTAPIADVARLNPLRLARLVWINNRSVSLMLADGTETRFSV